VDWFDLTLRWYLVTTLVTIAVAPVTFLLFRRVTDRGASVARPIALLLFVWPVWFLAGIGSGIVPFNALWLWISAAVIGATGWAYAWRSRLITRVTIRHFAVAEAGFLAAFAAFLWFRGFGPAANYQEKPSDLMMLASSMRSESMPPADAWLAGEPVNYYYLGYAIWAAFARMIDTTPAIAFNLALVTVFAMSFVAATGLAANVLAHFYSERVARIGGIIAAFFVLILGNPWATFTALGHLKEQWNLFFFDGIGWEATRTIIDVTESGTNPISEFPAFSFVLGDLHPHLLALPYTITALSFGWMLLTLGRLHDGESLIRRDGLRLLAAGGFIGALYAMNSWDFPTYLVIALLALALGTVGVAIRERLVALGITVVSAVVLWIPFYVHFEAPARATGTGFSDAIGSFPVIGGVLSSVASYQNERTSPQEYFGIFGFMYPIAILLIVVETWRRRDGVLMQRAEARGTTWEQDPVMQRFALVTAILCLLGSLIVPAPLLVLCGLPVIMIWLLIERDFRITPANIALVLYAIAMIMTLVPEFFYLTDYYGGSRMNTVFKVYYQVWLLMAVASALACVAIWKAFRQVIAARYLLPVGLAMVMAAGLAYPVVASNQWLDWRSPDRDWQGVDGLAYIEKDPRFTGEYAAISWLLDNADEDDVILAAGGGEWDFEIGRLSSGSGVPAVIGWHGHEAQWHLGDPAFQASLLTRVADITTLYSAPPTPELLDRYGVTLIYIGPTETQGTGDEPRTDLAPGPFPGANDPGYPGPGWTEVFNADGSRIYRRDGM
jgi:YYY domain-containing protein